MALAGPLSVREWLKEHESSFTPPVCNKLMYGNAPLQRHKIMFVGGPNVRKDYHIEEGEELFFQLKGDICLKIMEQGKPKDVVIKEGEMFLLPARIPHSPNRPMEGSLGLVIERERLPEEMDGLRYYVDDSNEEVLYEKWFHCDDLGSQLGPIIKGYFASEEHKTRVPSKDLPTPPVDLDTTTEVPNPFVFADWLAARAEALDAAPVQLFDGKDFHVTIYGPAGDFVPYAPLPSAEVFVWQLTGTSVVHTPTGEVSLKTDECMVLPQLLALSKRSADCRLFVCVCTKDVPLKAR
eukprot:TRINITY_DN9926_c0_g1_i1.p1 TRINITY_DN9926_c0_g1~~TRINITY_DN9926_c0_g1_i1.p1  ORF type:complete len:294 (+),score=109.06 TRINITY_DN9926_c0_g1_i1:62-943(+)